MQHEDFKWRACYADGSILKEDDQNGVARPFASVDQSQLHTLVLIPQHERVQEHALMLTDGLRPIFFRRRSVTINPLTSEQESMTTITCLGWQKTEHGHNVQAFLFLFSDGSTLLTDDRNAI